MPFYFESCEMKKINLEMLKKIFLSISIFIFQINVLSGQNYKQIACKAYITKSEQKWEWLINSFTKKNTEQKIGQQIELIGYYYGYISLLLDEKKYEKAELYVKKGEIIVNKYLTKYPQNSSLNSFKGAFIGFHIGLSKFSALYLATPSNEYVNKALSLNPNNCQALIDKGNILLHTPWLFGGNKEEAVSYFRKAVGIYERKKHTSNNWLYLNALDNLAKAYKRTEHIENAKKIIIKRRNTCRYYYEE